MYTRMYVFLHVGEYASFYQYFQCELALTCTTTDNPKQTTNHKHRLAPPMDLVVVDPVSSTRHTLVAVVSFADLSTRAQEAFRAVSVDLHYFPDPEFGVHVSCEQDFADMPTNPPPTLQVTYRSASSLLVDSQQSDDGVGGPFVLVGGDEDGVASPLPVDVLERVVSAWFLVVSCTFFSACPLLRHPSKHATPPSRPLKHSLAHLTIGLGLGPAAQGRGGILPIGRRAQQATSLPGARGSDVHPRAGRRR